MLYVQLSNSHITEHSIIVSELNYTCAVKFN